VGDVLLLETRDRGQLMEPHQELIGNLKYKLLVLGRSEFYNTKDSEKGKV